MKKLKAKKIPTNEIGTIQGRNQGKRLTTELRPVLSLLSQNFR